MDMPSRIEMRRWLVELNRTDILLLLEQIRDQHGPDNEQDVRDFLNRDRQEGKANSPAEASLAAEKMPETLAEIESLKKLHRQESAA